MRFSHAEPTSGRTDPSSMVARAAGAGTPESLAVEAMRITRSRFPGSGGVDDPVSARAEAYFWGIIRRRALQGQAPEISRLLVISSLECELRDAGHSPEAIQREVARLYGAEGSALIEHSRLVAVA